MKVRNPLSRMKFYRKTINSVPELLFELLLYAACFFPFVRVVFYTGSDTQPYAALAGLLIAVVYWIKNAHNSWQYLVLALVGILMGGVAVAGVFDVSIYMIFRSYYTYFSLIFIPLGVFIMAKRHGGMNEPLMKLFIWVWFAVGLVQKEVNPEFAYNILSRHTTNMARGVVSLASEPSAYGFMCMFMMIIALKFKKNAWLYVINLLIQIVVFASSSVTLVYLAVYIGVYVVNELLFHKKYAMIKAVILLGGGIGGLLLISKFTRNGSRMGDMVRILLTNPGFLLEDESIVMRMDAIKFCFQEFWENHMLPHGMSDIKYMSGTGLLFYECGFIAVAILLAIGVIIVKAYKRESALIFLTGFMIIMLSSIPYSSPIVCFYLGWCLYAGWERAQERKMRAEQLEETAEPAVWYAGKLYREV